MPELNAIEVNQRPKNKCLEHRQDLCRDQQPAALYPIDDGAANGA